MTTTSTLAHRIRRYGAAASLVGFSALLVPQALVDPAGGGTGEVMWAASTGRPGALLASTVLIMASGMLMAPAVSGITHQARDRGAGLANLAAVLGVLGGFGHFGIGMFYLVALALPGGDRTEMVAYIERLNANPALVAIAFPLIACFALGILVMAWAAWRTGLVGLWGPVVVTAAVLAHSALPGSIPLVDLATLVAIAVVFGYLGIRVARMTDAEWVVPAARGTVRVAAAA